MLMKNVLEDGEVKNLVFYLCCGIFCTTLTTMQIV